MGQLSVADNAATILLSPQSRPTILLTVEWHNLTFLCAPALMVISHARLQHYLRTVPRASQFSPHICCGQMAGWIKMPRGSEVGLSPSDTVLDGDLAPPPPKGGEAPNFWPIPVVAQWLDGLRYHLVGR